MELPHSREAKERSAREALPYNRRRAVKTLRQPTPPPQTERKPQVVQSHLTFYCHYDGYFVSRFFAVFPPSGGSEVLMNIQRVVMYGALRLCRAALIIR